MMSTIFPNYCLKDITRCCMESECEPGSLDPCLHCQYWKPSLILYNKNNIETSFSNSFGVENNRITGQMKSMVENTHENEKFTQNDNGEHIKRNITDNSGDSYTRDISSIDNEINSNADTISISEQNTIKQQKISYTTLSIADVAQWMVTPCSPAS